MFLRARWCSWRPSLRCCAGRATGAAASNLDLYQVNCTYYDALGRDDAAYLLARAVQVFVPGIPQVYYVGALAGHNDLALLERTGVGRDINRHRYTEAEISADSARPAVRAQKELFVLRNTHPAFAGECSVAGQGGELSLAWVHGEARATLLCQKIGNVRPAALHPRSPLSSAGDDGGEA